MTLPLKKILFVCSGNTCRSVIAEGLFNAYTAQKNLGYIAQSCGTHASETYRVPPIVAELMGERKVYLANHISTQISKKHVEDAACILAMDESHINYIQSTFPASAAKTFLLRVYVSDKKGREIFDPIGQSEETYRATAEVIEHCIVKLIDQLEKAP